jgi:hypothetical protein
VRSPEISGYPFAPFAGIADRFSKFYFLWGRQRHTSLKRSVSIKSKVVQNDLKNKKALSVIC